MTTSEALGAAPSAHGAGHGHGHGTVVARLEGHRSVLAQLRASSPLKFLQPTFPGTRSACACLLTFGGGLIDGDVVDVTGTSKGKGTAGVMKRHGFHGLSASHGVHRKHRSPGSIGGCATPGRVFKGMRMAGRMGNAKVTVQNLTIHAIDAERGLLLVRGAIPGNNGSLVVVRTAAKQGVLS